MKKNVPSIQIERDKEYFIIRVEWRLYIKK